MLDCSRYSDSDVQIRCNDFAGLSDLIVVGHVTSIYRGPRRSDGRIQLRRERFKQFEVLRLLQASPPGDNHSSRG